jgi:prepilin-type N-terminal cleavage/methylation domain-containing protein/prepilin-type processing-associated H-X9-DG protein
MLKETLRKSEVLSRPKGFTLIELLIVIAIIALLLSISIPALSKAKKYAQKVICQSNLKQWGIVLDLYTRDNKSQFFKGPLTSSWNDWVEVLRPYCEGRGSISCCPLATKTLQEGGQGIFMAWSDEEGDRGSYGLNAWVCNSDEGVVFERGSYWNMLDTRSPYSVPVFLDSMQTVGWPEYNSAPPAFEGQLPQEPTLAEQMKKFCINRHRNGSVNCLFMDWSVRAVGLKELWKMKWHKNFNINGPYTQAGGMKNEDWPEWMRKFEDY